MKKFRFKFDSVLKIRKHKEKQAQLEFAKIQQKQIALQQSISAEYTQIEALSNRSRNNSGMAFAYAKEHAYIAEAHGRIIKLEKQLKMLEPEIEKSRRKLIEANKQTRMLENLKDKLSLEHLEEERQREMAVLDEIATLTYNYNRRD